MRQRQQGVSVVVLAVGVAVVLVLGVVVIPTLLPSHLSASESATVASLQMLNTACATYAMSYGGYPKTLANLGPGAPASAAAAGLIDPALASGTKDGYVFSYTPGATGVRGNVLSYSITANAGRANGGRRHFFMDQSGVIRANTNGPAGVDSPPIG